ncbi:unnamed protein product [Owenia fusiformis]|uniref:Uncharacterized protein n=1 Tax=Owenia fusiformis TaxID=6347 RepID=A0A8S4N3Z5_OWEFU|nr:unnamed protein product [Owenia fusiformis]
MRFDEVLQEHVGGFGPYQWGLYILIGLSAMPSGWQSMANNYLVGRQQHWCNVPALSNLSHARQKYISIPLDRQQDGSDRYTSCHYYSLNYSEYSYEELMSWNRSVRLNGARRIKCDSGWVYDRSLHVSTLLSKWDIVCDIDWQGPLVSTIYIGGMLVGSLLSGVISDRFGRKVALMAMIVIEFIFAFAGAFMPNYPLFCICRFAVGGSAIAIYIIALVYIVENIGAVYRSKVFIAPFFLSGYAVLSGLAYGAREFENLQVVMAVPRLVFFSFFWIIPESPRWLVSQKRQDEAIKILTYMAEVNGRTMPDKIDFTEEYIKNDTIDKLDGENDSRTKGTIVDLVRTPRIRARYFIMCTIWFVTAVYYGLSLNSGGLAGSVFVNTTISAVADIIAWLFCINSIGRVGRKWPLVGALIFGGIACLLCIPFLYQRNLQYFVVILSNVGKIGAAASFQIIYTYTSEMFPTGIRAVTVGSASMVARISAMASQQLGQLDSVWLPLPSVIFGSTTVVSGFLALFLPETLGKKLPETIEDGELFGTKKYDDQSMEIAQRNGRIHTATDAGHDNHGYVVGERLKENNEDSSSNVKPNYDNLNTEVTRI